ncbi:MAG: hypothetical protein ABIB43_06015 [archaeon]
MSEKEKFFDLASKVSKELLKLNKRHIHLENTIYNEHFELLDVKAENLEGIASMNYTAANFFKQYIQPDFETMCIYLDEITAEQEKPDERPESFYTDANKVLTKYQKDSKNLKKRMVLLQNTIMDARD